MIKFKHSPKLTSNRAISNNKKLSCSVISKFPALYVDCITSTILNNMRGSSLSPALGKLYNIHEPQQGKSNCTFMQTNSIVEA